MSSNPSPNAEPIDTKRALVALIVGQICLHSCMAGVRVAAPLLLLNDGHRAWLVGILLGLFAAAPVLMALRAGRMADRYGYHRPMRQAVMLTFAGAALAVLATWGPGVLQIPLLFIAAPLCGVGANYGLIAIQRSAGKLAEGDRHQITRIFSWLGLAPAISNVVGPLAAGFLIDSVGFGGAFAALALMPLWTLWWARRVPVETPAAPAAGAERPRTWDLLEVPGMQRLLLVNWLTSSSWDLHSFTVPVLGHERGFSASAIGMILGGFALSVAAVRMFIPFLSHRLKQSQVLAGAMLVTAAVFVVYPWAHTAWLMAICAAVLGIALGATNPMIMTALHDLTPDNRHGEAIALRSMTINSCSAVMPLVFGFAGSAIGAGALFWLMGAAIGAGSSQVRHFGR
jgi:MFS family permease